VCADAACDGGEVLHADTDGTLAFTAPASPYTHSGVPYGYCRDDCRVEVHGIGTDNRSPSVSATYAVAAGTVTATPSTGLADGQAVQVEGTDLVRTYEGPTLWIFPTGGWALTQCDRAVLDDVTLGGLLVHCAAGPPTRGVTVEGTSLDTTLEVRSTITKILGGTTDCAAAPGRCVVGLARFEQDGSVSAHLAPVSFG